MSFGWSGSDVFLLAQLAWNTVQNSRKACGEYDELTRETLRLHAILKRLEQEVDKSDSPINRPGDTSKEQLELIASDCEHVLKQLDKMVAAYAALSEEKRSARKIWQKVRFSNGQMADLGDLRSKVILYTSEMLFYVNLVSMDTVGRIEQQMTRDGGVLRDIKIAVEKKTAHSVLSGVNVEGSILTRYADDDTGFWRALRRELVKEGLPSATIHKHKHLIKAYVKELGTRGVLDDGHSEGNNEQHDSNANPEMLEEIHEPPNITNFDLDGSQQAGDKAHDQDVDLQVLEDDQDLFLDGKTRERIEVETKSQPPRTDAKATISQASEDRSGRKPDSSSDQERPEQPSRSTSNHTGHSDYDFETKADSHRPPTPFPSRTPGKAKIPTEDLASSDNVGRVRCIKCLSDDVPVSATAKLPCLHRWCRPCLRQIFIISTTEEQHMPPTCCTKDCIELKHVDKLFDNSFKKKWNRKSTEFHTKNRIYCPARGCGSWIKPTHVYVASGGAIRGRKFGRCQRCKMKVCCTCNNKWHLSSECFKDATIQEFINIAHGQQGMADQLWKLQIWRK